MHNEVYITMFRANFSVSHCRRTSWGTLLYFRDSQHLKNLCRGGITKTSSKARGKEEESHFCMEKLWPHSTENLRRPALLSFNIVLVSKKNLRGQNLRIFCQGVARFPVDSFMSHSTDFLVDESVKLPESSGY